DDPNAPTPKELRDALRKANNRIEQSTLKITAITERITEVEDIMKKVEAGYSAMEKKDADTLRKVAKLVADGIKDIRETLNGKPQTKQGY
ncbi:hypothetical protein ACKI1K_44850, partial [Streptomyces scabiei]|uniref:hypothetical protein n=1 Tax=Streptomyces scabiei TaxID=1930 RepID=UPI0038F6F6CD